MKFVGRLTEVLILAGILGFGAIILANWLIESELWKEVVEGVGIGLLVASLVGTTVERYAKQQMRLETDRMLQEVRSDVFRASLGSQFPESLWVQIWNHLLLRPVVRRKVSLDYQLELLPDYPDFVKVRVCWSYTLCNLNPTTSQEYRMLAALDRPFHKELSDSTNFTDVSINGVSVLGTQCGLSKTRAEEICEVKIQLEPNEEKQVTIRGETVLRADQVVPHSMVDSTEDLEISVSKPEEIEVVLDPLHPREDRLTEVYTASEANRKCWRIPGGILPGHGVCIRWYPASCVSE